MARTDPYASNDVSGANRQLASMLSLPQGSGGGSTQPAQPQTQILSQYTPWQNNNVNLGDVGANSLTPSTGNQPSSSAPISYEPTSGQNSLTQLITSLNNLLGGEGYSQVSSGTNVEGSGLDTTQAGLNLQNMPTQFWQSILSGNPAASSYLQQANAPYVSDIAAQYANVAQQSSNNMPLGGYRATSVANAPTAQANAVSNIYAQEAQAVPTAAEQLSNIGTSVANTGTTVSGQGISQQNQGLQAIYNALSSAIQKNLGNQSQTESNISNLVSGLSALI